MSKTATLRKEKSDPVAAADWTQARSIRKRIITHLKLSVAWMILLGRELEQLKARLGFAGSGRRRSDEQGKASWGYWCRKELGVSDDTANRLIDCFKAAKARVKEDGLDQLVRLLESKPGDLCTADEKLLEKLVREREWPSQKQLLEELKDARRHASTKGGRNPHPKEERQLEPREMAQLEFGVLAAGLDKLDSEIDRLLRSPARNGEFLTLLAEMPLADDGEGIGLLTLRKRLERTLSGDLKQLLKEVRALLKQQASPTTE